jgi:hypothetical protein
MRGPQKSSRNESSKDDKSVLRDLSTECGVVSISNDQTDSRTSPALKYSTHMEMINWFVCDVP